MVVFRHLMATPHRSALLSQIDKLLDEKVLLGPAISSREILRFATIYKHASESNRLFAG